MNLVCYENQQRGQTRFSHLRISITIVICEDSERFITKVLMRLALGSPWDGAQGHSYSCNFGKLSLKTIFRKLSFLDFPLKGRDIYSERDHRTMTLKAKHDSIHFTRPTQIGGV